MCRCILALAAECPRQAKQRRHPSLGKLSIQVMQKLGNQRADTVRVMRHQLLQKENRRPENISAPGSSSSSSPEAIPTFSQLSPARPPQQVTASNRFASIWVVGSKEALVTWCGSVLICFQLSSALGPFVRPPSCTCFISGNRGLRHGIICFSGFNLLLQRQALSMWKVSMMKSS